jgi:general secretion pathway protein G
MNCHLRIRQRGFTLIEMLVVIAIIGIIAALLIPNLLDSMQKAKQKRTLADLRIVGVAMFAWLTDQSQAGAAGQNATTIDMSVYGSQVSVDVLDTVLVTQYIQDIPYLDGWKNPYQYYLNIQNPHAEQVMAIRSLGRDGVAESSTYTVTGFDPTDYDRDIVWADGFMVRWPDKGAQ